MKAVRVHQNGGPEQLRYEEAPIPIPGPMQARICVKAAGLNFIDVYHRTGLYKMPLPFIPGMEAAGIVEEIAPDVTEVSRGDRVAYAMCAGAYAEYAAVDAWKLVKLPNGLDYAEGAAVMLQGMTAHYLTHSTFPLRSGETALVHAAAGGAGLLLVQIAKLLGARVIGTVSTPEKAELARAAGADHVILYESTDFEAEVRGITEGRGVDVVYDSVGKSTFDKSLNCLRRRGMLVLYGQSSGAVPPMDPNLLNAKGSLYLTRPGLAHYAATRDELQWRAGSLFQWVEGGQIRLRIDRAWRLAEAAEAHRALEGRRTAGKVLFIP